VSHRPQATSVLPYLGKVEGRIETLFQQFCHHVYPLMHCWMLDTTLQVGGVIFKDVELTWKTLMPFVLKRNINSLEFLMVTVVIACVILDLSLMKVL
jgi:hypothetical protein